MDDNWIAHAFPSWLLLVWRNSMSCGNLLYSVVSSSCSVDPAFLKCGWSYHFQIMTVYFFPFQSLFYGPFSQTRTPTLCWTGPITELYTEKRTQRRPSWQNAVTLSLGCVGFNSVNKQGYQLAPNHRLEHICPGL